MLRHLFHPKRDLTPIFSQQAAFLCQASEALVQMLESTDAVQWKRFEKEIKTIETQGDALLTEFREQLSERLMGSLSRTDLTTVAMSMDDCLDVIKDASKAILIYRPLEISVQLQDLAQIIRSEAYALRDLLPMLWNIRSKASSISLQCDRVAELEHTADDAYEEFIGYIFSEEEDFREMTKNKNLAELFEKATDSEKHVADCVRLMVLKYLHE
ncbi:MAG: DUF47 family protein [Bacteroidales bacterium]|nr:DUF47 family protein [Bacteroidales bacterium]